MTKRGSDKEAKAKNEATLRTAMLIRCEANQGVEYEPR